MPIPSQSEIDTMSAPQAPEGFTIDQSGQLPTGFELDENKYGSAGGQLASAALGLASGATLGLSNVALTKSGLMKPETLKGYQEENPIAYGTGEIGSVLVPGGALGLIGKAGKATYGGIKALNAIKEASELSKLSRGLIDIGAHAAGSAVEGAAYAGVANTMNEYALGDPSLNGEKIMSHFGQGALYGGLFGAALKTAAVGAPPALKAGMEGLTQVKNALMGAGHGEESLISKGLDLADTSGSLSDAWMNRAKNIGVDQQAEMVKDVTDGLNTVKKNFSTAQKDLNSVLRPAERDALIGTANEKAVIGATDDVIGKINTISNEVKLNPGKYSGGILKDLEDMRLQAANNLKDKSAGGRFDLLKDMKQTVADWGKGAANTLEVINTKGLFKDLSRFIGDKLTNPDIFGAAGASEAAHNQLLSEIYSYIPPIGNAREPLQKEFKKLFLGVGGDFDASKMKKFLALSEKPEGQRAREILDNWFDLQRKLPEHFENTYANVPNDLWDKAKLSGVMDNLEKTHGNLGTAQTEYAEALRKAKGSKLGLRELMLGSIGAVHPLIGAAGFAIDVASKPIEYINKLAEIERLLGKATDGVQRAAKGVFTPAIKVLGKTKAPLIRQMITPEEHEKLKDHLNQANNDPAYLMDQLEKSTGGLHDFAPDTKTALQQSMMSANKFLASKLPPSQSNNPFEEKSVPSSMELAQFERYREIVEDPTKALEQMKHGILGPETIETLSAVYPKVYEEMKQTVLQEATNRISKKEVLPYSVKQQISFFLGQPIDSSLTPMAIQASQATHTQSNQEIAQKNQQMAGPKPNQTGMGKIDLAKRSGFNKGDMSEA